MKINEIYGFADLVLSRDCAKPRKFDHQKISEKKLADMIFSCLASPFLTFVTMPWAGLRMVRYKRNRENS